MIILKSEVNFTGVSEGITNNLLYRLWKCLAYVRSLIIKGCVAFTPEAAYELGGNVELGRCVIYYIKVIDKNAVIKPCSNQGNYGLLSWALGKTLRCEIVLRHKKPVQEKKGTHVENWILEIIISPLTAYVKRRSTWSLPCSGHYLSFSI